MKRLLAMIVAAAIAWPGIALTQTVPPPHLRPVLHYYEMPDLTGPLLPGATKATSFRLRAALEIGRPGEVTLLEMALPQIQERWRAHMGSLQIGDIRGSAAMFRLREVLIAEARFAVPRADIKSLVFKDLSVQ